MPPAIRKVQGFIGDMAKSGFIDPREVEIRLNFNPRSAEDVERGIEILTPQIIAVGRVHTAITIGMDGNRAFLVAGETRLRSLLRLIDAKHPKFLDEQWPGGRVSIPFVYDDAVAASAEIACLRALSENEGRKLNDFDKGVAYARLLAFGHDVEWLVQQTGLTARYIESCLALAPAPMEVREAVADGKLSRGAAVSAMKEGSSVAKALAVKAKASPVPIKRAKAATAPPAALQKASTTLAEALKELFRVCDEQAGEMVYEIHRDVIAAIRTAV